MMSTTGHYRGPRHRLAAYVLVALVASFGVWRVEVIARSAEDTAQRVAQISDERRISGRALLYSGCRSINEVRTSVDDGFQLLAVLSLNNPDASRERISRALDALRGKLNPTDCEHVVAGLPPDEAEAVRSAAARSPSLPLPPPTVPGYVPSAVD